MSNAADAVIMNAIHTAFESYPKEGDPDWRSPSWIMPDECAHLTRAHSSVGWRWLPNRAETIVVI